MNGDVCLMVCVVSGTNVNPTNNTNGWFSIYLLSWESRHQSSLSLANIVKIGSRNTFGNYVLKFSGSCCDTNDSTGLTELIHSH